MLLMPAGRPDREDKLIRWRLRETRKQGLIEIDGGKQREKDRENEVSGEKEQLVLGKKRWLKQMEKRETACSGGGLSRCVCCRRCSEGSKNVERWGGHNIEGKAMEKR